MLYQEEPSGKGRPGGAISVNPNHEKEQVCLENSEKAHGAGAEGSVWGV